MQTTYEFNKVCEYSRSRSFHDDLILQDQASGERSQDQWSSGIMLYLLCILAESHSRIYLKQKQFMTYNP